MQSSLLITFFTYSFFELNIENLRNLTNLATSVQDHHKEKPLSQLNSYPIISVTGLSEYISVSQELILHSPDS
eukprot:snap_masked-scaffold_11-processed-gene-1.32-mRNA-1 protein AED:1.00 eAED:1.00 QI:0/0/0/0/1/1/2/0/72